MNEESKQFSLNMQDLKKIGLVLLWSGASAIVAALITLIPNIDIPTQYLFLVPVINTILVSIKKFIDGQSK